MKGTRGHPGDEAERPLGLVFCLAHQQNDPLIHRLLEPLEDSGPRSGFSASRSASGRVSPFRGGFR